MAEIVNLSIESNDNGQGLIFRDIVWLARTLPCGVLCSVDPGYRAVEALGHRAQTGELTPREAAIALLEMLGLKSAKVGDEPADLPCLALLPDESLAIVRARTAEGFWLIDRPEAAERRATLPKGSVFIGFEQSSAPEKPETAREVLWGIFSARKGWILQLFIAWTLASILLLGTSFYSMQVYDRVVGNGGIPTLVVLTIGVALAIMIEFLLKLVRHAISHGRLDRIEVDMASAVFARVLGTRLDALPPRLGGLAAQMRGYEVVKNFWTTAVNFWVCEFPFALFFLSFIYLLGGVVIALVPTAALGLALCSGFLFMRRISSSTKRERKVSQTRQGHLVEVLRSMELIKASAASWRVQGRWDALTREGIDEGAKTRSASETAAAIGALIQQISYVGLVATGACLAVARQEMTTGSIVACSILSGRIFAPIARLPALLVQWGHAREALETLGKLFACPGNHGDVGRPVLISDLEGRLDLRDIDFTYGPRSPRFQLESLSIAPGEKVAILGRIGTGKSTLLKMMAGLIRPGSGRVLVDGVDVFSIMSERRAELLGYLPQTPGLLQGTVRENLLMGRLAIDDDALVAACARTGLAKVLATRPEGLETPISEGGAGFSGGQTQLIALTRLLLVEPRVWLLDEPTASLDREGEREALLALRKAIKADDTLVLVTHKLPPLEMVERVVVIDGTRIVADGPRDRMVVRS